MIQQKKILVVVANGAEARFFIAHGLHNIVELEDLYHPAGRLKNHELTTKEHDVNTTPYEDKNSQKTHEQQVYSSEIANKIQKVLTDQDLKDVCIVAPPKLMGVINKDKLGKHINVTEITKDLINVDLDKLVTMLRDANLSFM